MSWKTALVIFLMSTPAVWAERRNKSILPADATAVKPVNVPAAQLRTVSGTVTVRLDGVLATANPITYYFAPEFPVNAGSLSQVNEGTYFLRADNVPADRPYKVTVFAVHNSTVFGRDGVIERRGKTFTGSLLIDIPYGDSAHDFGVRFIELR